MLWKEAPALRELPEAVRKKLYTLQKQVEDDLKKMRKWRRRSEEPYFCRPCSPSFGSAHCDPPLLLSPRSAIGGVNLGDILKRLTWIDRDKIATVALDVIKESGAPRPQEESFALDPFRIWTLLGGLEGLEVIEHNCQVRRTRVLYTAMAPEALVVAEQLRLNAGRSSGTSADSRAAAETGNLQSTFAAYAQRATVTLLPHDQERSGALQSSWLPTTG